MVDIDSGRTWRQLRMGQAVSFCLALACFLNALVFDNFPTRMIATVCALGMMIDHLLAYAMYGQLIKNEKIRPPSDN